MGCDVSDKTMFLLMFLVSSALLIYVEISENDKQEPECEAGKDSSMLSAKCAEQLRQEEIKPEH